MSKMPLWMGDKGEQAQGLPQVQNQARYQKNKEDLSLDFGLIIGVRLEEYSI
jgi:hypothetical protein